MLLSVKNLSTHFHAGPGKIARAVDGVSFDLEQGKTLALVGESGCGKTQTAFSIIKLIAENGYHPSGEIIFKGRNLSQSTQEEMRQLRGKDIAMIFQEPMTSLNPLFRISSDYRACGCFGFLFFSLFFLRLSLSLDREIWHQLHPMS